ncbi:MAG: hypothetical protein ACT4OX_05135 [Actinomycetota bacterium]
MTATGARHDGTTTPADRASRNVVIAALAISVVHYTDNTIRFDEYPTGENDWLTPTLVPMFWALFAAGGVAGYLLYRRGQRAGAAAALAFFSVGGLVSPLHYTEGHLSEFDAFQHVNIAADLLAGLAVLAFAAWIARGERRHAK